MQFAPLKLNAVRPDATFPAYVERGGFHTNSSVSTPVLGEINDIGDRVQIMGASRIPTGS